jgi:ribosomal protein S7
LNWRVLKKKLKRRKLGIVKVGVYGDRQKRLQRRKGLVKLMRGLVRGKIYEGARKDRSRSVFSFLSGMLMRCGNRRQIEVKLDKVFSVIRRKCRGKVEKVLRKLKNKLKLRVGLFKRKISGTGRSIPVLLPKYKGNREGWKRLVKGSRRRNDRGIVRKMSIEILEMMKGRGYGRRLKEERVNEIGRSKVWLKYMRS